MIHNFCILYLVYSRKDQFVGFQRLYKVPWTLFWKDYILFLFLSVLIRNLLLCYLLIEYTMRKSKYFVFRTIFKFFLLFCFSLRIESHPYDLCTQLRWCCLFLITCHNALNFLRSILIQRALLSILSNWCAFHALVYSNVHGFFPHCSMLSSLLVLHPRIFLLCIWDSWMGCIYSLYFSSTKIDLPGY